MGNYQVKEAGAGAPTSFVSDTVATEEIPQWREAPFSLGARATKTVAAAGTAEALPSSASCRVVYLRALPGNQGRIAWGFDSGVKAAPPNADYMEPGEGRTIPVSNPSLIFIDAEVSGEGVAMTLLRHVDS